MCVITTLKLKRRQMVCIRSCRVLLQIFSLVYPLAPFFLKKRVLVLLGPTIATAGVAGLFDFHFGQFREVGLQSLPDPVCEVFTGGIL